MQDEILDLVDKDENVIEVFSRNKGTSAHGYLRFVNIFVINFKNQLLLPQRSTNRKKHPGCYDFSCGEHVQSGETYLAAAVRGMEEELGLKNVDLRELGKMRPSHGINGFAMIYEAIYNGDISEYDRDGIASLQWVEIEKIKRMLIQEKFRFKSDYSTTFEWYLANR